MYPVRNSVKAIITRDNKLLCIRKQDAEGFYYVLPGGGQERHENFVQTVQRECLEELGVSIKVNQLKYIREYIGLNHEFKQDVHQVEFMFDCELLGEPDLTKATNQDPGQSGLEWILLGEHSQARIYPKVLLERLINQYDECYWGDIN